MCKAYEDNPNYTDPSVNPECDLLDSVLTNDKLHQHHKKMVQMAHEIAIKKANSKTQTVTGSKKPKGTIMNNDNQMTLLSSNGNAILLSGEKRGKGRPSKEESARMDSHDKDGFIVLSDEVTMMVNNPTMTSAGWLSIVVKNLSKDSLSKDTLDDLDWVFFGSGPVTFEEICSMGNASAGSVRNEIFHILSKELQNKLLAMKDNENAIDSGLVIDLDGVNFTSHKMSDHWAKAGEKVVDIADDDNEEISIKDSSKFDLDAFNTEFSMDEGSDDNIDVVSLHDVQFEEQQHEEY